MHDIGGDRAERGLTRVEEVCPRREQIQVGRAPMHEVETGQRRTPSEEKAVFALEEETENILLQRAKLTF